MDQPSYYLNYEENMKIEKNSILSDDFLVDSEKGIEFSYFDGQDQLLYNIWM